MSQLRIAGGTVYDPANGINGEVRDVCIDTAHIVADLPASALTVDAGGMIVMPGGVDVHSHVASASVNLARRLLPEEHVRDPAPAPPCPRPLRPDIAIVTRAGPARLLGLRDKGHLGSGADADVTVYSRDADVSRMFATPRYVVKAGVHTTGPSNVAWSSSSTGTRRCRSRTIRSARSAMRRSRAKVKSTVRWKTDALS